MIFGIGIVLVVIGWLAAIGTGSLCEKGTEETMTLTGLFMSSILLSAGIYLVYIS